MTQPIEIELYEEIPDKPGYVRHTGNRSINDIFNELSERLKAADAYPDDGLSNVVRWDDNWKEDLPFPDHRWISCFAVTGASEGHYIHIEVIANDKRELLFLGKTFQGFDFAYKCAAACARFLGA